jgi:signal transduction histidine kinase/ligand-binding sensor domain-containing protein
MFNSISLFDRGRATKLIKLAVFVALVALSILLPKAGYPRSLKISQLLHTTWTARDGAPQGVKALAEASDGTLWVGTYGGLFNFNGLTFKQFKPDAGQPDLPTSAVSSLYAARDGSLWVGMFLGGVARIHNGQVTLFDRADDFLMGTVTNFQQAPDGSLWALATRNEVVRMGADGAWHKIVVPPSAHPLIFGFWIDSRGTLWVPRSGRLYKKASTDSHFEPTSVEVDMLMSATEAPDGTMWVTDALTDGTGRTQHFDAAGAPLGVVKHRQSMWKLLNAPDDSLWIASQSEGLFRIPKNVSDDRGALSSAGNIDRYVAADGLTSDGVGALLLDSSGNIWVGGSRGLDRFRPGILTPFVADPQRRGNLCANRKQRSVLITPDDSKYVYLASGETVRILSEKSEIQTLACGPSGDMWMVNNVGIWRVHAGQFERIPMMPDFRPYSVQSLLEGNDGTLFVSVNGAIGRYWTYKDGVWTKLDLEGISSRAPLSQFMDDQDRLWAGYRDGTIGLRLGGAQQKISTGSTGLGAVTSFLQTSGQVLAAGLNGIAVFEKGSFRKLDFEDREAATGLTGLADTQAGELWLLGARGIVHVTKRELLLALADSRHPIKSEILAEGDFVGPAPLWLSGSSVIRDSEDRIWFGQLNGIVSLDRDQVRFHSPPVRLSILSIQADGQPLSKDRKIPPDPQTLIASYFGVDLSAPEKVSYKYHLEGLSEDWQEVGQRTEAIYTNLHPGTYTFRVMATNGDGTWTTASSAPFTVRPDFFQSLWFVVLCTLAAAVLIWLIIAMRVRLIARAIRSRAEERADERIRIARDLHDTLLQGVQGLMLNIHVATESLRSDDKSKAMLQRALSTADRIIIEGRNRVASLRSDHVVDAELLQSLENVAKELSQDSSCSSQVRRTGGEHSLKPHIADEIFFIAREALTNAFRHSGTSLIEVNLEYGKRIFKFFCIDNGRGFSSSDRAKAEVDGHWGFRGMAERAAKSNARFAYETEVGRGTKIIVTIPARHAYQRSSLLQSLLCRFTTKS